MSATAIIGGAATAAATTAANAGLTSIARAQNAKYNEIAAQNADRRTRALYNDLYSPQALLQQYKKAGLSPSLMYSQGGSAGTSVPTGAQGGGSQGLPAPQVNFDFASNALLKAQIDNIQADTEKKQAEAGKTETETDFMQKTQYREAEERIKKIAQETNNKKIEESLTALKIIQQEFDNAIKAETAESIIKSAKYESEKLRWQAAENFENWRNMYYKNQITKAQFADLVKAQRIQNELMLAETFEKYQRGKNLGKDIELKEAQIQKLITDIYCNKEFIKIKNGELELEKDKLKEQVEQWLRQNNITERGQNIELTNVILDFIVEDKKVFTNLIDSIIPF